MSSSLLHHSLGDYFETDSALVFFGNKNSDRASLEAAFPAFTFIAIKQTHSDIVVKTPYSGEAPEADAHFTHERQIALCIRTADCTPVMIYDPVSKIAGAIHAGWRGIENEIIRKTCRRMLDAGADLTRSFAWIGPHIGDASFEVGLDVAEKLETRFRAVKEHSSVPTALLPHLDSAKARVNLLEIARAQLSSFGLNGPRVIEHAIDTFTSNSHESFRRDREKSGRQTSFIVMK